MDIRLVIGLICATVVAFFAWQWYSKSTKKVAHAPIPVTAPAPARIPSEPVLPEVAGQSEQDLRQKEPLQHPSPPNQQEPVTHEGHGPAEFDSNLRRPEQSFHQPSGNISMNVSEVPSGRAVSEPASPASGEQGFSPEMAQNDGPIVGNNMYAFDGMEPTGFATF